MGTGRVIHVKRSELVNTLNFYNENKKYLLFFEPINA